MTYNKTFLSSKLTNELIKIYQLDINKLKALIKTGPD